MFSDKECKYEKLLFIITVIILTIVVSACGNESKRDIKQFERQYKEIHQKQHSVEKVMDKIPLKELDNLSKTDTTDKNKKNFVHFSRILITI